MNIQNTPLLNIYSDSTEIYLIYKVFQTICIQSQLQLNF